MPPRRKLEMYAVLEDDAEEAVVVVDDRLRKSPKRGMPLALPDGDGDDSPEELFSEWSECAGGGPTEARRMDILVVELLDPSGGKFSSREKVKSSSEMLIRISS